MKTCLVNGTRKEYINMDKGWAVGEYLLCLETSDNWDLRYDNIYISYTLDMFEFKKLNTYFSTYLV